MPNELYHNPDKRPSICERRGPLEFSGDWREWPMWLLHCWWEARVKVRSRTTYGYGKRRPMP